MITTGNVCDERCQALYAHDQPPMFHLEAAEHLRMRQLHWKSPMARACDCTDPRSKYGFFQLVLESRNTATLLANFLPHRLAPHLPRSNRQTRKEGTNVIAAQPHFLGHRLAHDAPRSNLWTTTRHASVSPLISLSPSVGETGESRLTAVFVACRKGRREGSAHGFSFWFFSLDSRLLSITTKFLHLDNIHQDCSWAECVLGPHPLRLVRAEWHSR